MCTWCLEAHRICCERNSRGTSAATLTWIVSASDHRAPETDNTDKESLRGTNGREKNPCDEARDYWENRKGDDG